MSRIQWVWIVLLMGSVSLQAQTFSAFVDKSTVSTQDALKVSFKLENVQGSNLKYPDFEGFTVVAGPNTSSSTQFINGQVSQSVVFSFYLRPLKAGTLRIGPATVEAGGKTLSTEVIEVKAVAGKTPPQQPQAAAPNSNQPNPTDRSDGIEAQLKDALFMHAAVSKRDVYQGEQITVTYKLYRQVDITQLVPEEPPRYEGFWVESVDVPNVAAKVEVVDGKQYRTSVIKQDILFPQRSGKLTIDPLKLTCTVRIRTQQSRQPRSVFDNFFGSYENYEYTFANSPVVLDVKPLPASSRPADFNGMIGKLNLAVELDKTETETGEPITLKVRVSGQGNIKKLPEPKLDFPPDFDVYDPNISEQVSRNQGKLGGRRTYEYLLVPRNPGQYQLPKVAFSYFDVEKKRYESLSGPEFSIQVTGEPLGGGNSNSTSNLNKEDMALIGQAIRHIETGDPNLNPQGHSPLRQAWFLLLYLVPFLVMGSLLIWQRKRIQAAADVAGTKAKRATKVARKRLAVAKSLIEKKEEKAFYNEVVRALWGYLGDRFKLGQSELNRDQVQLVLREKSVSESIITELTEILDTCEMALFAPVATTGGMQGVYDQAIEVITEAESNMAKVG